MATDGADVTPLRPVAELRQYLQDCETRARSGLTSSGLQYSQQQAAQACERLGVRVSARDIDAWLMAVPVTVPPDWEPLWALRRVWAQWAGEPAPSNADRDALIEMFFRARALRERPDEALEANTAPQPVVTPAPARRGLPRPAWIALGLVAVLGVALVVWLPLRSSSSPSSSSPAAPSSPAASSAPQASPTAAAATVAPEDLIASEDFAAGDATPWPSQWVQGMNPPSGARGTTSVENGVGVLTTSSEPSDANRVSRRLDVPPARNASVSLNFALRDALDCFPQIYVRADSKLDTRTGYSLAFEESGYVLRGSREYDAELLGSQAFSFALNTWYSARLDVHGTRVRAKVWPRDETEPRGWAIDVTSDRITAAGAVGLTLAGNTEKRSCSWMVDDVTVAR
ncbi:hypothetical protein [Kineosporia succinea]|uniref:Uncharacterized protein n=1 Tax=Kineosporia succinea TaxID=84632 RepID=A0ABT9P9B4_9ACTN|nr:hypothetical protein [Kineosporia succinea]MDP9829052.1 hypothetical protein [Kineosporia succinea]